MTVTTIMGSEAERASGQSRPDSREKAKIRKISLQGSGEKNPESCKLDYLPKRAKPDAKPLSEFFTDDFKPEECANYFVNAGCAFTKVIPL